RVVCVALQSHAKPQRRKEEIQPLYFAPSRLCVRNERDIPPRAHSAATGWRLSLFGGASALPFISGSCAGGAAGAAADGADMAPVRPRASRIFLAISSKSAGLSR